ncbi:hypothetical protein G6L37_00470 [Agrobacterium rubi]|nr:hypothetical protein [Agrobacterium rubi]NTF23863.1 hypothetical protein [Agrobacterium rubi]
MSDVNDNWTTRNPFLVSMSLVAVGCVLMSLPFAIQMDMGIAPASLGPRVKFCVMVAMFSGLAMFMLGSAGLLGGKRTKDQDA